MLLALAGCGSDAADGACAQSPGAIYAQRIEPLLTGPSTCNQCHLSGLSLADLVTGDPCRTMACLVEKGEVDLAEPGASNILDRVLKAVPQSTLVTQEVIDAEYVGMAEWIQYSSLCQAEVCGEIVNPCAAGPPSPASTAAPLGGCDEPELVASFESRVFAWRGRCGTCHASGADVPAPEFVDFESAARTMYNIIGIGAIDRAAPHLSRLLTKPLAESHPDGVAHAGGDKFVDESDPTYQDLRDWIERYVACFDGSVAPGPTVEIDAPLPESWLSSEVPATLSGRASAADGAPIEDAGLSWSVSGVAEPLGTGRSIQAMLPAGRPTITLEATAPDGRVARRRIRVFVGGGCRAEADLALIADPAAFYDVIRLCPCPDRSLDACLTACATGAVSSSCLPCVVAYETCARTACASQCAGPNDSCGHCITAQCGSEWERCAGIFEPGAE